MCLSRREPAWETMLPVAVHVPVTGSYSSAEARALSPFRPPMTSTLPSGSGTAAKSDRGVIMLPVAVHDGARGGTAIGVAVGAGEGEIVGPGVSAAGDVRLGRRRGTGAGSGGTSDGSRTRPEPAATAPPTSSRAAAAKSVMPAAAAEPPAEATTSPSRAAGAWSGRGR